MNNNYFKDLASCVIPSIARADKSESIVNAWVDMATILIEQETGEKIDRDEIMVSLSDSEWTFLCQNPEDDEDESDFFDLIRLADMLDATVEDLVRNIKEDQDEYLADLIDLAAHGIHYSTIYTANDGYKGGPCQHSGVLNGLITWKKLAELGVTNIDSIRDQKDVSAVIVDTDHKYIIQASGYNYHRGMFCDVY